MLISTWNKFHSTLKIGVILLIIGTSPLIISIIVSELGFIDIGNAVGPGIIAFVSFYPSIILILIGSILSYRKNKKQKKD